jgi:HTH-type transcriptional repressor of NAD biosynthesis genes
MVKAFVFGKFMPFHKGHEAMIRFALLHCDFLTVLVCCSNQERISGSFRIAWIENTFENDPQMEVRIFDYMENDLPNTSESSRTVSEVWAQVFMKLLPDVELLVTSEEYGYFVADSMNICHIPFDIPKQLFPVSATAIRHDRFSNWSFLPESVKQDLALKVVLVGTESTGKTTLAEQLSKHFNSGLVLEAGRDLIPDSTAFSYDDLSCVTIEHSSRIATAIVEHPLIIIDTDIHITKSYSRFVFDCELEVDAQIYAMNKAHLYLYLNNDVPHFQDGTRLDETERNLLDLSHRQLLKEHGICMAEITGDWQERFDKSVDCIHELLELNRIIHASGDI